VTVVTFTHTEPSKHGRQNSRTSLHGHSAWSWPDKAVPRRPLSLDTESGRDAHTARATSTSTTLRSVGIELPFFYLAPQRIIRLDSHFFFTERCASVQGPLASTRRLCGFAVLILPSVTEAS